MFNATLSNISAILWHKALLMEETVLPGGNHRPVACKSIANLMTTCCIENTSPWEGFELTTLVMISTDCTDSKSNYYTIGPWRLLICLRIFWRYDRGYLEAVNCRTGITMAKIKRTKGQTMIYKTLHRKLKIKKIETQ